MRSVIAPLNTNTGVAKKIHPFQSQQVITIIIIRSSIAFVASIKKSPDNPSCIVPTITIAPIHTVSDAVTNAVFIKTYFSRFVLRLTAAEIVYKPLNFFHKLGNMEPHRTIVFTNAGFTAQTAFGRVLDI